ncbi:MAG: hypothetical protein JW843_01815 [Candidatus Aminicenantes bacterium]|nr:hypothetical protein [Candidatus Aminicenantes bacterium]
MAKRKDPLVWGLVLIVLGLVFILENMGLDAWDYVWRFWPVILIVWGASKLIEGLKNRSENSDTPQPPSDRN